MDVRGNIDWLPSVCVPAGDQTRNLPVYGTTLQPTEPHGQDSPVIFNPRETGLAEGEGGKALDGRLPRACALNVVQVEARWATEGEPANPLRE